MKKKKLHPRNQRMVLLKLSRRRERMLMELMEWRLQRRKDPDLRVGLVEDREAVTDVARGLVKGANQGQNPGKDQSDLDPRREDGDPGARREEEVEAGPEDVQDLEIIRARRVREIGGLLKGRRSLG